MNILYLCHRFPYPPKRGGKIRPFNMISHLSNAGHQVTVCSLARSAQEAAEAHGISQFCAHYRLAQVQTWLQVLRMAVRLPLPVPSSMGYFHSSQMARQVHSLLQSTTWDLIFVHCSSVAHYVDHVKDIPKILDFGDMDSQKWLEYANYKPFPLSLGYWLEGVKMRAAEKVLARRFDLCTATTRAEFETLNSYSAASDSDWFPNGVDAHYFSPATEPYDADTISFIGRMDYYPNQECMARFCAQVWPLLKASRPGLKLLIVGADPSPAMRRLGDLHGVTVTGSVPDVRPFVHKSALMVAPLLIARGTQNKILESMAMGVPVVTSTIAAAGIDATPTEHLLVADTPDACAQAILTILDSPKERLRLAQAGRQRMLSHHTWPRSMERLDGLISRGIRNHAMRLGAVA